MSKHRKKKDPPVRVVIVIPRSVKARIDHEAKAMLTSDQQSPNRSAAARMLLVRGIIALDEERGIR